MNKVMLLIASLALAILVPCFAYFPMNLIHGPLITPPGDQKSAETRFPKDLGSRERKAGQMVHYMDALVGRLLTIRRDMPVCDSSFKIVWISLCKSNRSTVPTRSCLSAPAETTSRTLATHMATTWQDAIRRQTSPLAGKGRGAI